MKIGLDFWNCITQFPDYYRDLADSLLKAGHEVHIISAYGNRQLNKYGGDAESYGKVILSYDIPHTLLHLVYFGDDDISIPELKWNVIAKYGMDMMIDDRPSTVQYLHERGVMALLQPKPLKK